MAEDTLPQMPEPEALGIDFDKGWDGVLAYGYTADQLRAYAAQAVAQERARAIPAGWRLVPEEWTLGMRSAFLLAGSMMSTGRETAGWKAALAAAPQPPSAPPASAGEEKTA